MFAEDTKNKESKKNNKELLRRALHLMDILKLEKRDLKWLKLPLEFWSMISGYQKS